MVPLVLLGRVQCEENVFARGGATRLAWEDKADAMGWHGTLVRLCPSPWPVMCLRGARQRCTGPGADESWQPQPSPGRSRKETRAPWLERNL